LHRSLKVLMLSLACLAAAAQARTLREAVQLAGPQDGYDKYVVLETGEIYTGGLQIGPSLVPFTGIFYGEEGYDLRIVGNGALLDLEGQRLCISYCNNRLDIDDCIVINGDIRYRGVNWIQYVGVPTGFVRHVTFYGPHDHGVKMMGAGTGITLERNLIVNAVDTGFEYIYTTGISSDWIPTGASVALSMQGGSPQVRENWSFHSSGHDNANFLRHFVFL